MRYITYAGVTGRGSAHDHNEDAVLVQRQVHIGEAQFKDAHATAAWGLAVVDGMGGNNGGEIASATVAQRLAVWENWSPDAVAAGLKDCNRELYDLGSNAPALAGLGATIAGLAYSNDVLHAFNVGDARVYRFSGGYLQPLTRDDSLHQVLVDAGKASGDRSAAQHTILQSLGGRPEFMEIEPHLYPITLQPSMRFVVCTDGITDMLDMDAMEAALQKEKDVEGAARALYEAALAAGGKDNLSVIVLDVEAEPPRREAEALKSVEGHLQYRQHAAGSKSDSQRPHLLTAAGNVVRLHRTGSNPFAEDEFRPLEGRLCRATGNWDEVAQVFLVSEIQLLDEGSP